VSVSVSASTLWCACVVYVPRVCVSGVFNSVARPLSFRTWTIEYKQRVLECWSGFAAYQHRPTAAAGGRWVASAAPRTCPDTHAHSNDHQVGFGTCSGSRVLGREGGKKTELIDNCNCPGIWFVPVNCSRPPQDWLLPRPIVPGEIALL